MALRPASSSPASSVCGRDPAQDASGSKRRRISAMYPFAFEEKGEDATSEPSRRCDLELEERVWKMLPEDIFEVILASLPFAAQSRFRCVCRKWKDVRCPPSSFTIRSRLGDWNAKFYCETEKKWFCLPSNCQPYAGWFWELVDVDAGLVCYQSFADGRYWLRVSNPLKSSLLQVIKPDYPLYKPNFRPSPRSVNIFLYRYKNTHRVKLLVDRANKTYRVVALIYPLYLTAVYEPTSSAWRVYYSVPEFPSFELYVRGNVLYAYNTKPKRESLVAAFNMELGEWVNIQVEVPSECRSPKRSFFLSNSNQVMLISSSYRNRRPYFSLWKLMDDCSLDNSFSKWEMWEKVSIGSVRAVVDLTGYHFARADFRAENICFTFYDDKSKEGGYKSHKCVGYSFTTNSWSVVPYPGDWGENFKLYNWEPSLDLDPSFASKKTSAEQHRRELPR